MDRPAPALPRVEPRTAHRLDARICWSLLGMFLLIIAVHALGIIGSAAYPVVTFGGVLSAAYGMRRYRPSLVWPWGLLMASGIVWTAAGIVRDSTGATGDFTTGRSLLPDLLALPGYGMFGLALYGLLRSRRGSGERGALLDGIMLGVGALLLVNELLVEPTLDIKNSWLMARIAVAIYPAISMCLLTIAARLAFAAGDRSPAFRLLLVGTTALLIGDIVFALGEVGAVKISQSILEIPYLLVPACIGTAATHPSIRSLDRATRRQGPSLGRGRLLAVAGALLVPIVLIARRGMSPGKLVTLALCLVLAGAAVIRLAGAMKQQAASEARLAHQATHDELTGLPSRVYIVEHTEKMMEQSDLTGDSVALMFIDLDQFKLVNDSMGHNVGDQLLVLAAQRISGCVRPQDIVGRISGDEFILVAVGLDAPQAFSLADRIRQVLGDAFYLDAGEVFISVSIGITVATGSGTSASTLIQEADTAMYRSKEAGRNTVTMFDTSMRERVARRVVLERQLRHALNEGHFAAFYQPIVALPSGRVHGFEALARWVDGGHMISPAEFIPIAEESGLIVPLGKFMLDDACKQLAWWRASVPNGEGLYMSVNLSPRQVRQSDIVDTVAEALDRYRLPGDALWLEITESLMMEDSIATAAVMSGLRALGVRLSVDDFGTGFSSLSYLKRFPVSRVKIDRAFVTGLGEHTSDSSLVAAILAMGSALDLDAVAEGVESLEQAERLFELGCRMAQGYLFSKAVPAADVPETLDRLGIAGTRRTTMPRRCATTGTPTPAKIAG
jgi:diguanylate cyclase (GGDEF)-like protein